MADDHGTAMHARRERNNALRQEYEGKIFAAVFLAERSYLDGGISLADLYVAVRTAQARQPELADVIGQMFDWVLIEDAA